MGHPHANRLESVCNSQLLPDKLTVKNNVFKHCQTCVLGKFAKLSFASSTSEVDAPFDLIHCDLWGPSPILSRLRYKYFVLFIDHFTRFTWVYFLRAKSELANIAKNFVTMIETQFGKVIKIFRSDPGGEFCASELVQFFSDKGILTQQSCPGTPEQNGVVERKNRHGLEIARTLLLESSVPPQFWVEAIHTAVHFINMQTTPILRNQSLFFILFHKSRNYINLRVFG